jgi:SAM-dependent methyltransferase
MDDPAIDPALHRAALARLRTINALSLADRAIAGAVADLIGETNQPPVRILDVATGSGDVALATQSRLASRGIATELMVCDRSSTALAEAHRRARRLDRAIETIEADVLTKGIPLPDRSADIAMCSLFLHHLTHEGAVGVIREMARIARRGIVISDLRRCRAGWVAAWAVGALSGSRIVRIDAPRSVEGAFTLAEARSLAREAGLTGATAHPIVPWRFLLVWARPGGTEAVLAP